jgi:hypothetical protein
MNHAENADHGGRLSPVPAERDRDPLEIVPGIRYRRPMELNDWVLALHLLSAFALVGAMIVFWVGIVVIRRTDLPEQVVAAGRLFPVATVAVTVGSLGTIIFGVWLAISLDGVAVWSGWVIAAILLWAFGTETGRRSGPIYALSIDRAKELVASGSTGPDAKLAELGRSQQGLMLHTVASLAILLILVDMIWKPGA